MFNSITILLHFILFYSTVGWPTPKIIYDSILQETSNFINRTAKGQQPNQILNFFPIPVSEECKANDGRRTGICMNAYECRIQQGSAHGPCALGFGVCCVFVATCGDVIRNNVTYFINPDFPGLTSKARKCEIKIDKIGNDISQYRLDFIHFNLGQPNRATGKCETDLFLLKGGNSKDLQICGQNNGQHVYYDVENVKEPVTFTMNMTRDNIFRMWEIKVSQIEFNRRAPAGCLQYFQEPKGIIQTMNYAINGRHLANQDYQVCIRQSSKMCTIAYEPCDDNSFKIGSPSTTQSSDMLNDAGSGDGPPSISPNALTNFRQCSDRIIMPCDLEEFINPMGVSGMCDLLHCGNTFCGISGGPCRIESAVKPFNIRILFGPGRGNESPEDNIGMCLKYEQLACT